MARRRAGTITTYTLADGSVRYIARLMRVDPRTGKRVGESVAADSRAEAEAALAKLVQAKFEGATVDPSRMTVTDLMRRWLEEYSATARLKQTTIDGYQITIDKYIATSPLGRKRAQTVRVADIGAFVADLARSPQRRSAELALERLRQAFRWGVAMEYVRRDVTMGIALPTTLKEPDDIKALSHAESRAFLKAAQDDFYWPLWRIYLATGIRRGEGLGLRWQDLDLDRGTLSVRQHVVHAGKPKRPLVQTPKSKASIRTIDLDDDTLAELELLRDEVVAKRGQATGLVFCTRFGTPHNPRNVLRAFTAISEAAGISGANIHALRHTHASQLLLAGHPIVEVSQRLGHGKVSITLDTYAHLIAGHSSGITDSVLGILSGTAKDRELPELPAD